MSAPYKVERNGVIKTLTETVFGKKSDKAGQKFYTPVLTEGDWDDDSKWVGLDNIVGSMNKILRIVFAGIYQDNIDETTGQLNETAYLADCADFTAGVQKLSDLEEQLDELSAEVSNIIDSETFGTPEDDPNNVARMKELAVTMKSLRAQKQVIEAKYAVRAQKRAETKAKKEAEANAKKAAA